MAPRRRASRAISREGPVSDAAPWFDLIASVRRRRSYEARFFKPVCLVDLVSQRAVKLEDIDLEKAIRQGNRSVRCLHSPSTPGPRRHGLATALASFESRA